MSHTRNIKIDYLVKRQELDPNDSRIVELVKSVVYETDALIQEGTDPFEYFGFDRETAAPEMDTIDFEMPEGELYVLMKKAHEKNITFNRLLTDALKALIEETIQQHESERKED